MHRIYRRFSIFDSRFSNKRGQAVLEYIIVIVLLLAAFLIFQKYIARGLAGRWRTVGDALGDGRIYDPYTTVECAYDFEDTYLWYDVSCYETNNCSTATDRAACVQGCVGQCNN